MSNEPDMTKMPWANIARFTGYVAAGVASLSTLACALAVQTEKKRIAEMNRVRWTDAARWEKPGRDY